MSHPNFVKFEHFGQTELDGRPVVYAVFEKVDANLAEVLDQGPLTVEDVAQLASSLVAALDALHPRGFIHGHIEPRNIFAVSGKSGDPDAKIAGCTALLKADQDTNKNRAVIYGSRSVGYYSKGDYDRAIQDADQAILLNPNEPSFYYTSGPTYKKKGDFDRAIQNFNEAIHLSPNFERAYYDRGNAYMDKEEYDRATQDLNEAIRLDPNNANNYNNRDVAYTREGD